MRRRALLSAAGAALCAGCSGLVPGGADQSTETVTAVPETDTATDASTPTPDDERELPPTDARQVVDLETGPRTLSVVGTNRDGGPVVRHGPDDGDLRVGFTETATADGPAVLEATLLNTADWENTFRLQKLPPFGDFSHARLRHEGMERRFEERVPNDTETGLYLAPTANHDLVDDVVEPRRGPEGYWQTPDAPSDAATVTLEPGEHVTGEYHVLGHWDRAGFPAGTYVFGGSEWGLVLSAWDSTAPGPTDGAQIAASLPSLFDDDETSWFHEADASTELYLEPERERVETPGRLSFRLVNRSRDAIGGNPYDWGLYKLADGSWHRIAPYMIPMPASTVSPGDAYGYTLAAFHGERFDVDDRAADLARSVGRLGGGRYAFVAGFQADGHRPPAAAFDLDAPTVPLSVPDRATRTDDGGDPVVTFPSWGDDEHPPDATLTVEPVDAAADGTLIREVVARDRFAALEAALAAIGDRERVVVRADDHAVENVTGHDSTRRLFDFEGTTYVAEKSVSD